MIDSVQKYDVHSFKDLLQNTEWAEYPPLQIDKLKETIKKSSQKQELQAIIANNCLQRVSDSAIHKRKNDI